MNRLSSINRLAQVIWMSSAPFVIYGLGAGSVIALLRLEIVTRYDIFLTGCIVAFVLGSIVFLLPRAEALLAAVVFVVVLWFVLYISNELKASAVSFPMTMLDVKYFFANPTGLLISVGAPGWIYAAFYAVPFIATVTLLFMAWLLWKLWRREKNAVIVIVLLSIAAKATMVGVASVFFYGAIAASVDSYSDRVAHKGLWKPEGLVAFSRSVGILGFLVHTDYIEAGQSDFFAHATKENPPTSGVVMRSVDKFLDPAKIGGGELPNIMIIHAESTFDLYDVLKVKSSVKNSLFYTGIRSDAGGDIQLHGPLLVNTIGGGSWITEFEILLGIDSRLFGSSGQYTHASLSGYAEMTFPRYLKRKGYELTAYSSDNAAFYGYGKAYLRYGFGHFYDRSVIANTFTDPDIMSSALRLPNEDKKAPFLKFVILFENHSPHACKGKVGLDKVELDGVSTADQNCAVNEYARRARSTEVAVNMALDYLRKAEAGRPRSPPTGRSRRGAARR